MTRILFFLLSLCFFTALNAQKVIYSEPDRDDTRRMNFEVVGKVGGNFMIYKNIRDKSYISIYDNEMNQIEKKEHDYMPGGRLINVDFFPYPDHAWMIYQYQKKNIVYCNAVKLDETGSKISDIVEIDTSHIGFSANNKIYSAVSSEDKDRIMVFKINSRNRSNYVLTSLLLDERLALQKRSTIHIPMEERNDYLDEFLVDNEGNFVFTKFERNNNDNITRAWLMIKEAAADTLMQKELPMDKIYLDEPHLKVDNPNGRYFFTSFYYKQRRGNIEGFYFYVWDKATRDAGMHNTVHLGEEIRQEAKGDANMKTAFNDYFIRNIIVKRDGEFIIGSEAYYTTSRFGNWNRWNYLFGSPFSSYDYYNYSPMYNSWYWRSRYNSNQAVRHHADNITILSFDPAGKLQWSNVIHKEQFDDEADDHISYQLVNTGSELHFVFNEEEKRMQLLNDYTLTSDGQISRNPTLKNLDRGYEFLPKYSRQVSARQVIIPCYYKNYICFAKLDYNS